MIVGADAGTLQNRAGGMLLWREGAAPVVVDVIENTGLIGFARTGLLP